MKYIFDVDGTLTPSRAKMDNEFANWFEHFATHNAVYLVTGSDREKTLEQIPKSIYNLCVAVYQCSGNDVWQQDNNVKSGVLNLPDKLQFDLLGILHDSGFKPKTSIHIDNIHGQVNFSIHGSNDTLADRYHYKGWDDHKKERESICNYLRSRSVN